MSSTSDMLLTSEPGHIHLTSPAAPNRHAPYAHPSLTDHHRPRDLQGPLCGFCSSLPNRSEEASVPHRPVLDRPRPYRAAPHLRTAPVPDRPKKNRPRLGCAGARCTTLRSTCAGHLRSAAAAAARTHYYARCGRDTQPPPPATPPSAPPPLPPPPILQLLRRWSVARATRGTVALPPPAALRASQLIEHEHTR